MNRISAIQRLSLSLVMLVLSAMFTAQFLGLLPNRTYDLAQSRVLISEALAVQLTAIANRGDVPLLEHVINEVVSRNPKMLSAAFRTKTEIVASAGDHHGLWHPDSAEPSLTHISVPIIRNKKLLGNVEVRFQSSWESGMGVTLIDSSLGLFIFMSISTFLLFALFLKRALSELNPANAVPDRVRAAFDVLSEGVLILDSEGYIVLANDAISEGLQLPAEQLIGKTMSNLPWADVDEKSGDFPWLTALKKNERVTGVQMEIARASGRRLTYMVNAAPIRDSDKSTRGALVTFDDMSSVERKNRELNETLGQLEESQKKISRKNKELETLARIDPLTGCHNRRALFEWSDQAIKECRKKSKPLTCFMIDIDHFKSINDRYGHAVGDQVINCVGEVLSANSRSEDIVGRYGGEEFCVVSPDLTPDIEQEVAERIRRAISVIGGNPSARFPLMRVTASVGYATCLPETKSTMELVNMADSALYVAKEAGRNRVSRYNPDSGSGETLPPRESPGSNVTYLDPGDTPATPPANLDRKGEVEVLTQKVKELEDLALKRADEIWHRSLHDSLTGLPNRVLLLDRATQDIRRIPRHGNVVAGLSIEIDTFQRVNDTLGHEAADELIKEVTNRLNDVVRHNDTVGVMSSPNGSTLSRVTSNEFMILLSDLFSSDTVTQIVRRARGALSTPFSLRGEELFFSGNLGISLYPQDASDAHSLLKNASAARAHARSQGRRLNVAFFSEEMQESSTKELRMEALLHKAIDNEELWLAYQPKVEISTGAIIGVEALARWRSPTLGNISPMEFVPIAERSGLIHELTGWVLKAVCLQLKAWQPIGIEHMRVALNLSPLELRNPGLGERFLRVLSSEGVSPELLEVEITETGVIENMDTAVQTLENLKNSGVRVSIDDFGTGYSSFGHLTSLPLDVLKIDGCFVRDIDTSTSNRGIVEAIIAMANTAGLRILAEGVETEAELDTLRAMGCHEIQGYLYSKPLAAPEITKLIIADTENTRRLAGRSRGPFDRWFRRSTSSPAQFGRQNST